jgi:hypothetical protein
MPARQESTGVFVRQIPKTINDISAALTEAKRKEFLSEVLAAEQGPPLDTVMHRWWMDAMLDRVPGREKSEADALAGRNLVPLSKLTGGSG